MRRTGWVGVVTLLALAAPLRAGDDVATATCDGPTELHVGDWAEYRVKTKEGPSPERERDELWTVEELTADAVLLSVKSGERTRWKVLPRREGTQAVAGVLLFAQSADNDAREQRPQSLTPPSLAWEAAPPGEGQKNELQASARRLKWEESYRHKSGSGSTRSVDVELDPACPVMAVKKATVTFKLLGGSEVAALGAMKTTRALRRHGAAAGGAAPAAPAGRTDMPILLRAKLEQNPFANLQVGGKARFDVTRTSSRPIGGTTKHEGRMEVVVSAREGDQLTLTWTVLEGVGQIAGQVEYVTHVPTAAPAALEPHRWIDQLLPMMTGELGGGSRCKSASHAGGRVTLDFEHVRYRAALAGSLVGFSSAWTHIETGVKDSWDEVELKLHP